MKINPAFTGSMSGSSGGITASRNRYGQYFRRKAIPVNPNSTHQAVIRTAFADAVQAWTQLAAGIRGGWNAYAANTPRTDSLGNTIFLTGQNTYIGYRTLRAQVEFNGGSLPGAPDEAPTEFARAPRPQILSAADQLAAQTMTFTAAFDPGATLELELLLYMGTPVNASRNFFKGPWRFIGSTDVVAPDVDGSIVVPLASLPWPWAGAGQLLPIKAVAVDANNAYSSPVEMLVTPTNEP